MNKKIDADEKRYIMLSIMDEIHNYCLLNGITYFLVGGSLLGAIRHKGFIPWDDDIDIGLPRKDYKKLITNFQSTSGNVEIVYYGNQRNYKWPAAKAIDKRTVLYEDKDRKNTIGVFVDIFPIDGIYGEEKMALKQVKKTQKWGNVLTLKHLSIKKTRSAKKNIMILLGKVLYVIPDRVLIKKINIAENNPLDLGECEYACNFAGAWGIREMIKSKDILETEGAAFEGRQYRIPTGYDSYLKTIYGDYMTPPPAEKQKSHHVMEAYWK